jgi:hypothetical protein
MSDRPTLAASGGTTLRWDAQNSTGLIQSITRPSCAALANASVVCSPCRTSFIRIVFRFLFSLCAICWHAVTLPPNGNKSTGRSAARGIEHARRGGCLPSEGTAGHCPSLGDSVRYGNVRHIHSTLAAKEDHLAQVLLLHRPQTQTKSSPAVRQGHQVLDSIH